MSRQLFELDENTPFFEKPPDATCSMTPHDCDINYQSFVTATYPTSLAGPTEGECKLELYLKDIGAVDVRSISCTHPKYEDASLYSFKKLDIPVTDGCGRPCPSIGREITYPVTFRLDAD